MRALGVLLAAAVLAAPGCRPGPAIEGIVLDAEDSGTSISVGRGTEFVVELTSNITTGYAWELLEEPDPSVLRLIDQEYESASPPDVAGGGGVERWSFETAGGGSVTLRMGYGPTFEESPPVRDFRVTINVSG